MADDKPPTWWDPDHPKTFRHPDKQEPWDETTAPALLPIHCVHCGQPVTLTTGPAMSSATMQSWNCPWCRADNQGEFYEPLMFVSKGHKTPRV